MDESEKTGSGSNTEWEERMDFLLQVNNDRLILQLQQLIGNMGVPNRSSNTTSVDSPDLERFEPWDEDEIGLSDPEADDREHKKLPTLPKNRPTRFSVSSLDTRGEILHRETLRQSHAAAQRRKSGRPSSNSILSTGVQRIRSLTISWYFEALSAVAILTHSVLIGAEVQYGAQNSGGIHVSFFILEQIFSVIFLTELFLRVLSEGRRFLWSSPDVAWNYMDLVLNITSVVNLVALAYVYIQDVNSVNSDAWQASANVRMLRILRLTRVIRVVRIVKIVRFIRALRSLVHSILGTMKVLLWSVFLLFMIMYVFAIFFTDVTNEYSRTHSTDDGNVLLLRTYFRDVEQSVLTLFQSITGGLDWGQVADDLHEFSRGWGYLYIFYVAFCLFAVLNVMTGMFCQSAIEAAERDQELQIQALISTKQQQVEMFMSIFKMLQREVVRSGNGTLSFMDFERLFEDDHVRSFFQAVDVEAKDAWTFFKLMDVSGDGELDADRFVEGCMRLKGTARSMDVSLVLQEQRRLRKKILSMHHMLSELRGQLEPMTSPERIRSRRHSNSSGPTGHVSI